MNGLAILVAAATLGTDYGWQPYGDGGLEYIIQIEPLLLDALARGQPLTSAIHPDAAGVTRFRIQVGTGPLPREGRPPEPEPDPADSSAYGLPPSIDASEPDAPASSDVEPRAPEKAGLPPVPSALSPLSQLDEDAEMPADTAGPFDADPLPRWPGDQDSVAPGPFHPDPEARPLEHQHVGYNVKPKEAGQSPDDPSPEASRADDSPKSEPVDDGTVKPWLPLSLAMLGLFASLGGNVYLGWIAMGTRRRYHQLIVRRRDEPPAGDR